MLQIQLFTPSLTSSTRSVTLPNFALYLVVNSAPTSYFLEPPFHNLLSHLFPALPNSAQFITVWSLSRTQSLPALFPLLFTDPTVHPFRTRFCNLSFQLS